MANKNRVGYYLFSDANVWHIEYKKGIRHIKDAQGITGRHRIIGQGGNVTEYRIDKTGYIFSIAKID